MHPHSSNVAKRGSSGTDRIQKIEQNDTGIDTIQTVSVHIAQVWY